MSEHDKNRKPDGGVDLIERTETVKKVATPPMYRVLLHNDDFTPFEFVMHVLISVFGKDLQSAGQIMMSCHQHGVATVGVFTLDVAETKVATADSEARKYDQPLRFSIEKETGGSEE
jgi:ATP-dependent Clp protease adaptor protein ClpS